MISNIVKRFSLVGYSCLCLALINACSGTPPEIQDLLLTANDFTGITVTTPGPQVDTSPDSPVSAQIEFSAPSFTLTQSIVMFSDHTEARQALAGVKQTQILQGVTPPDNPGKFQDRSGILAEKEGVDKTASVFFAQGRALVRVTLAGVDAAQLLPDYAERARVKAARQGA